MSAEKEKTENLLRFIDLMVRQTCRRAHYEYITRTKAIKEDKTNIYSIDHLKKVYDKPREHIYQLVKNPQKTLKGVRMENAGPLPKKEYKYTKIEQKMLLDFVKKVQDHSPKTHFVWLELQHYLFYAYRNFACPIPRSTTENLSAFFVCEMRELISCLRSEDESQVWLRIFTLLREYCIFAQWHYSQNDREEAMRKFFVYYEAMLTAAKTLIPVFLEFERDIIYKRYRVCWMDFNTFIFMKYFYESDRVKYRIDECLRTRKSLGDVPQTFALMNKLKKTWTEHEERVNAINKDGKFTESTPEAAKERKVFTLHKKLLSTTFWVDRSREVKKLIDIDRLDHNIFDLLSDRQFCPEGPGLNKNGQCICEECLIAKYKVYLDSDDNFGYIATDERTTTCRRCKIIVCVDLFQRHVNNHIIEDLGLQKEVPKPSLTRIISEKMDFVKLGDSTVQLSEMFNEKLKISGGETVNHVDTRRVKKNDMTAAKIAYEKFLQMKKEQKNGDKIKNGRIPSLREELIANGLGKPVRREPDIPTSPYITAEKFAETELMLREMKKNEHKPYLYNRLLINSVTSSESAPLSSPLSSNDLKQTKKCDCTYCEIFSGQRIVEPRENLRVKLFRKREKMIEDEYNQWLEEENNKISKLESRVPLPPFPSNSPAHATPPDLTDYSAIKPTKMKEIRGLVNYIEGTPAKNKAELAQKKAAKKARQREKRELAKLRAELEDQRKLEERTRQEEAQKQQLKKEQEKHEELKKIEEAKIKKKLKKERQAQKRQELAIQKNTIEETIPAMVTIKRMPGGENGTPSVTITLKGCTPDQDKLLTTLVEEPSVEIVNEIDSNLQSTNKTVPESKGGGKKKKVKNDPTRIRQLPNKPIIIAKDVKVTLAVDKNPVSPVPDSVEFVKEKPPKEKLKEEKKEREPTEDEIKALGNLRLPPGITITKIEGPVVSKNYLGSESSKGSSVLGKSGVIVVDTEKLIQKAGTDCVKPPAKANKKKRKKTNKKSSDAQPSEAQEKPKMVTLRNPMFQHFQSQNFSKAASIPVDESAPAAIFTSENGMVTIRSSRLQQSLENGMSKTVTGMPLIPDLLSEVTSFSNPNSYTPERPPVNGIDRPKGANERSSVTTLDAQEILSGLPGIEITKIDKRCKKEDDMDIDSSCQDAQVSIIPSNGTKFDLEFDKDDDWLYDSVFKPKDVLEDDMDDEELELEAFKRFCQQSVPPKEKTVAHFNVADIVLKKKLT